jgi:hypothetical protein
MIMRPVRMRSPSSVVSAPSCASRASCIGKDGNFGAKIPFFQNLLTNTASPRSRKSCLSVSTDIPQARPAAMIEPIDVPPIRSK